MTSRLSQDEENHLYIVTTACEPSIVTSVSVCHLTKPAPHRDIILSRSDRIEIWSVDSLLKPLGPSYGPTHAIPIPEHIAKVVVIPSREEGRRDEIMIISIPGRIYIMSFSSSGEPHTRSHSHIDVTQHRKYKGGYLVASDPRGRFLLIHAYDERLHAFWLTAHGEPMEVNGFPPMEGLVDMLTLGDELVLLWRDHRTDCWLQSFRVALEEPRALSRLQLEGGRLIPEATNVPGRPSKLVSLGSERIMVLTERGGFLVTDGCTSALTTFGSGPIPRTFATMGPGRVLVADLSGQVALVTVSEGEESPRLVHTCLGLGTPSNCMAALGDDMAFLGSVGGDSHLIKVFDDRMECIHALPALSPISDFQVVPAGQLGGFEHQEWVREVPDVRRTPSHLADPVSHLRRDSVPKEPPQFAGDQRVLGGMVSRAEAEPLVWQPQTQLFLGCGYEYTGTLRKLTSGVSVRVAAELEEAAEAPEALVSLPDADGAPRYVAWRSSGSGWVCVTSSAVGEEGEGDIAVEAVDVSALPGHADWVLPLRGDGPYLWAWVGADTVWLSDQHCQEYTPVSLPEGFKTSLAAGSNDALTLALAGEDGSVLTMCIARGCLTPRYHRAPITRGHRTLFPDAIAVGPRSPAGAIVVAFHPWGSPVVLALDASGPACSLDHLPNIEEEGLEPAAPRDPYSIVFGAPLDPGDDLLSLVPGAGPIPPLACVLPPPPTDMCFGRFNGELWLVATFKSDTALFHLAGEGDIVFGSPVYTRAGSKSLTHFHGHPSARCGQLATPHCPPSIRMDGWRPPAEEHESFIFAGGDSPCLIHATPITDSLHVTQVVFATDYACPLAPPGPLHAPRHAAGWSLLWSGSQLIYGQIDDSRHTHFRAKALGAIPRRIAHCPLERALAVGCVGLGDAHPVPVLSEGVHDTVSGNFHELPSPATDVATDSSSSSIRLICQDTMDTLAVYPLETNAIVSAVEYMRLDSRVIGPESPDKLDGSTDQGRARLARHRPYIVVGVTLPCEDGDPAMPVGQDTGYVTVLAPSRYPPALKEVARFELNVAVYDITPFCGARMAVAVDSSVVVFKTAPITTVGGVTESVSRIGSPAVREGHVFQLEEECSHHGHVLPTKLSARHGEIAVGDPFKSVCVMEDPSLPADRVKLPDGTTVPVEAFASLQDSEGPSVTVSSIQDKPSTSGQPGLRLRRNLFSRAWPIALLHNGNDVVCCSKMGHIMWLGDRTETESSHPSVMEIKASFSVGEQINCIRYGTLSPMVQMPGCPRPAGVTIPAPLNSTLARDLVGGDLFGTADPLVFATTSGRISTILSLSRASYEMLLTLEDLIIKHCSFESRLFPGAGRQSIRNSRKTSTARVLDGDLIQQWLMFDEDTQKVVAAKLGRSRQVEAATITLLVQDLRRLTKF